MLAVFVRLVAHVLFAFWKAAAFVRARLAVRLVLGTVATVLVTSFIAAVAVLIVLSSRRAAEPSGGLADAGALGTFISANGTTANEWQIGGANGPQWVDDAGDLEARNADASALVNVSGATITANSIVGAAGAGGITCNSMTGATFLPQGGVNYTAASGNYLTLTADSTGPLHHSSISDVGTGIEISAPNGTAALVGDTAEVIGNTTSQLGPGDVTVTNGATNIESIVTIGPTFQPQGGTVIQCTTGGTFVVSAGQFAFAITTSTLTSNCVINFAPNAATGYYLIDVSGVAFGSSTHSVVLENGTASKAFSAATVGDAGLSTLAHVLTSGANTLAATW